MLLVLGFGLVALANALLGDTGRAAAEADPEALLASPGVERPELGAEWPVLRTLCAGKAIAARPIAVHAAGVPGRTIQPIVVLSFFLRYSPAGGFARPMSKSNS